MAILVMSAYPSASGKLHLFGIPLHRAAPFEAEICQQGGVGGAKSEHGILPYGVAIDDVMKVAPAHQGASVSGVTAASGCRSLPCMSVQEIAIPEGTSVRCICTRTGTSVR